MFNAEDIEKLKGMLDSNGKIIISDDLSEKQKEKYEWINSLDIDLVEVLSRKPEKIDLDEDIESLDDTSEEDDDNDNDNDEFIGEEDSSSSEIVEDGNVSVDDLNSFF